ncbi:hypothetical protein Tco_0594747 [Tanacetum coccineum]
MLYRLDLECERCLQHKAKALLLSTFGILYHGCSIPLGHRFKAILSLKDSSAIRLVYEGCVGDFEKSVVLRKNEIYQSSYMKFEHMILGIDHIFKKLDAAKILSSGHILYSSSSLTPLQMKTELDSLSLLMKSLDIWNKTTYHPSA